MNGNPADSHPRDATGVGLRSRTERLERSCEDLRLKHKEMASLVGTLERARMEWEGTMDCINDMVLLFGSGGKIIRCNRALADFSGKEPSGIVGMEAFGFLESVGLAPSALPPQADEEVHHRETGRWFLLNGYSFWVSAEEDGQVTVLTISNITERKHFIQALETKNTELNQAYQDLKHAESQIVHKEKMASIGVLAAGVAHEINNPIGFILSNLRTLERYTARLSAFVQAAAGIAARASEGAKDELCRLRTEDKVDRILADLPSVISESIEGTERVAKIVRDLKSFSRVDAEGTSFTDINACLESAVNIAWNEIKYKAELVRDFGELPQVWCNAQQINQVAMNLLMNAVHAIDAKGMIRVRSWVDDAEACFSISDTGCGIPPENQGRVFEPFFTTKEVGSGTGLGLSVAYDIVKKHNGSIELESEVGKGTTVTVRIPLVRPQSEADPVEGEVDHQEFPEEENRPGPLSPPL